MQHQIGNTVAVHQNAAFRGALDLGEGQTDLFAVLCAEDVGRVDAVVFKIVDHIIAVLVVADLADEADLFAETGKADRDVGRGAADILVEVAAFRQRTIHVGGIEVDGHAPDGDHVERLALVKFDVLHR